MSRVQTRTRRHPARAAASVPDLEQLRLERVMVDGVTGMTLHPLTDFRNERVANLGVIYLQLGRYTGVESLYGWELYDRVLRLAGGSLKEDLETSPIRAGFIAMQFTGADGFYLLFDLSTRAAAGRSFRLEDEAERFRSGVVRRLRRALGRTIVDFMNVHATSTKVPDDPRVRPSRHIIRGLREAARVIETRETGDLLELIALCKSVISGRKLRTVFQPVVDIQKGSVIGHEALIRGPVGSKLERPDALFTAAQEGDMSLELENLCLETIFGRLPKALLRQRLFVNASAKLLTHSVFLDHRNLDEIRRVHPRVVIEISEKEVVGDYVAFRETLDQLRSSGLQIAIDDAGSGYSGLESILQLRPEYIKVANSIVHNLHQDGIKREIITALSSLGRQINAEIVAEGIEQPEEVESLMRLGVAYGQGYLLGRPSARLAPAGN